VRLLWLIHEKGDEAQKARLKEIVRTPKLRSLVRQHDRYLLRDLGLGPKRETNFKVSKKDRAWQIDTYKPPIVCEKPAKERSAETQRTGVAAACLLPTARIAHTSAAWILEPLQPLPPVGAARNIDLEIGRHPARFRMNDVRNQL
jgi:hypothetical protein